MGTKSSKPVEGENDGTTRYKVDLYGNNIRHKFDSGELRITDTELIFTGHKASFQWPIKELKRFGSAKKVFTIEVNEENAQLKSREVIFKSKYAENIYENFKNKLALLEGGGTQNGPATAAANSTEVTKDFAPSAPDSTETTKNIAPAANSTEETAKDVALAAPDSTETTKDTAQTALASTEKANDIAPAVVDGTEITKDISPAAPESTETTKDTASAALDSTEKANDIGPSVPDSTEPAKDIAPAALANTEETKDTAVVEPANSEEANDINEAVPTTNEEPNDVAVAIDQTNTYELEGNKTDKLSDPDKTEDQSIDNMQCNTATNGIGTNIPGESGPPIITVDICDDPTPPSSSENTETETSTAQPNETEQESNNKQEPVEVEKEQPNGEEKVEAKEMADEASPPDNVGIIDEGAV